MRKPNPCTAIGQTAAMCSVVSRAAWTNQGNLLILENVSRQRLSHWPHSGPLTRLTGHTVHTPPGSRTRRPAAAPSHTPRNNTFTRTQSCCVQLCTLNTLAPTSILSSRAGSIQRNLCLLNMLIGWFVGTTLITYNVSAWNRFPPHFTVLIIIRGMNWWMDKLIRTIGQQKSFQKRKIIVKYQLCTRLSLG